jgi:hypothetical protein
MRLREEWKDTAVVRYQPRIFQQLSDNQLAWNTFLHISPAAERAKERVVRQVEERHCSHPEHSATGYRISASYSDMGALCNRLPPCRPSCISSGQLVHQWKQNDVIRAVDRLLRSRSINGRLRPSQRVSRLCITSLPMRPSGETQRRVVGDGGPEREGHCICHCPIGQWTSGSGA